MAVVCLVCLKRVLVLAKRRIPKRQQNTSVCLLCLHRLCANDALKHCLGGFGTEPEST